MDEPRVLRRLAGAQHHDHALQDFDQAIWLNPQDAHASNNRSLAYHTLSEDVAAIQDYDEAIRLDPQLTVALYNRGLAYRATHETTHRNADISDEHRTMRWAKRDDCRRILPPQIAPQ
jgi:tetratricopeptide (TPR) repeat protein